MTGSASWFDRLCDAIAATCTRGKAKCTSDIVVEYDGSGPGRGRCKSCSRQFDVSETGFKDRQRVA